MPAHYGSCSFVGEVVPTATNGCSRVRFPAVARSNNAAPNESEHGMTYNTIESLEATPLTDDELKVAMGRIDAVATASKMRTYTELKEHNDFLQRSYDGMRKAFLRNEQRINDAAEHLKNEIANGNIDAEDVAELADLLGVELTEESTVTITINVSVTHAIGKGDEIDSSHFNIEVDTSRFDNDIDLAVDEFEIDSVEVSNR